MTGLQFGQGMAMAQPAQQWWRGSCLISSKPVSDVASDHKTLTDSEFPKTREFPQMKNKNTHGCFQTAFKQIQERKSPFFTMEGLLGVLSSPLDISFFHQQLQLAWQKWLPHNDEILPLLIKSKATRGEVAVSVSKQQDTSISSSCLVEQEIIVLLLISRPS